MAGVAFKKTFSYAGFEMQPKKYQSPKIALLNVELELKAEKDNAEVRVNTVEVRAEMRACPPSCVCAGLSGSWAYCDCHLYIFPPGDTWCVMLSVLGEEYEYEYCYLLLRSSSPFICLVLLLEALEQMWFFVIK